MDTLHAVLLALLQGLTEFLPISSSGHLILVPRFLGWPDQGLAFDVAVHVGTLTAVLLYFRQDVQKLTRSWLASLFTRRLDEHSRLAWGVLLGTIPVGLVGLAMSDVVSTALRDPRVIAATTIGFGLLLGAADFLGKRSRDEHSLTLKDVMLIGVAQAMAIGERLFMNNCAQCHGSDARGSKGFPNLTDKDWLHGGSHEKIQESLLKGRVGQMPPMAAVEKIPNPFGAAAGGATSGNR